MNMQPTYMLNAKISDISGSIYINFPRDLADSIMDGMSASDFIEFKERSGSDVETAVKNFLVDKVYFKVRSPTQPPNFSNPIASPNPLKGCGRYLQQGSRWRDPFQVLRSEGVPQRAP